MSYCTLADMIARGWEEELVLLTDKTNMPASTIDVAIVESNIADAVSIIDGYIGKRYALPLTTVPTALKKVTADVARFYLHGDSAQKDSPQERAFGVAQRWLRDVSNGLIILENAGLVPGASGGGQIKTTPANRVFSRDTMGGF